MELSGLEEALPSVLDFSENQLLSAASLQTAVASNPNAKILKLDGSHIVDSGKIHLVHQYLGDSLMELSLVSCQQIDSATLCDALSTGFPALYRLDLRGCNEISPGLLAGLVVRRQMLGRPSINICTV
mmetsp:Transcript_31041/g.73217  ORF Transcript_31041/g.73217 Transcript_31041/m.73217 type:complete len:128 (+) Transcript_31041:258-641(+)